MIKTTIYVLGNPVVSSDNAAVKLIPRLRKSFPHINFIHFDPTEELPAALNQNLILIDTVIGIERVTKFDDLDQWKLSPRVTVHDYDLPLMLGVLKKLRKIKNITIFGIPEKGNRKIFLKDLGKYLQPAEFEEM